MERVTATENTIEVFENDIDLYLHQFCEEHNIDNMCLEGQRRWKACLQYIGKRVFPNKSILRDSTLNVFNNNPIPTNANKYNYDLVEQLCDYYIYISNLYDKFVSTEAFSYLSNIPKDTIDNWKNNENNTKLSTASFRIWKKLQDIRLETIKDDALDNGNVTGTMFVGNTEYGLNLPGVSRETTNKSALTAAELPKLAMPQTQQIQGITDNDEDSAV